MRLSAQTLWLVRLLVVFVIGVSFSLFARQTTAAEFSSVLVRPDRTKAGTSPGSILIQARVGESVTEDGLRLTLGSAWSGSGTAGTYTVSTSSLPSGVTAWPGISTATNVSGQQITFPSNDLTSGTTYGFYLTGGISTNPASAGDSEGYLWTLATLVGGNPSSVSDAMIAIVANDQVTISATIEPPADDFSASLSTTDDVTEIPQDMTITYTITYGSEYDFASPLTLQAEWTLGTISGNGTPTVELLSYVAGSADDAYGGTSPVINLTDRTITWTIASFPANTTGETVTFQLETTDSYTGSSEVTASVMARITDPVSTVDSTGSVSYLYVEPTATPTPTPSPTATPSTSATPSTATPTPSPSATPSPTPSPTPTPGFDSYTVTTVTDTSISLDVLLSSPSALTVRYGRSANALTEEFSSPSAQLHTIPLTNLLPNTTYYVQFSMITASGQIVVSDLLQFTTAQSGGVPIPNSVTITSNGTHLWTGPVSNNSPFLLPSDQPIEVSLAIANDNAIESIVLYRDLNGEDIYTTTLVRTQPGVWSGRLSSPIREGDLEYSATIRTTTGSQQHLPIFSIWVASPLRVLAAESNQPIERAQVLLFRKDPNTQLYVQLLSPEYLVENPLFTRPDGTIQFALPPGEYKAEISAVGYESQAVTFSTLANTPFPTVTLQPSGSLLLSSIRYHGETILLKIARLTNALQEEAQSSATLKVVTLWTVGISAPLSVIGLLAQAHFSLATLFSNLLHHFGFIFGKSFGTATGYIPGAVTAANSHSPVAAVLTLVDQQGKTQTVLQSHKDGTFAIPAKLFDNATTVLAMAPGFAPQSISVDRNTTTIGVELSPQGSTSWKAATKAIIKKVLVHAFETNLVVSLVLGIAFTFIYESPEAKPFLAISSVNALIFAQSRLSAFLHTVHFGK